MSAGDVHGYGSRYVQFCVSLCGDWTLTLPSSIALCGFLFCCLLLLVLRQGFSVNPELTFSATLTGQQGT